MATDIICKAVRYKNPKTGTYAQRAAVVTKEYSSNDLYDFAATNGYLPAGSKKEVIMPAYAGIMAAAKALIETTGNSRVVLSDWLAVSPSLRNATLESGNIPAKARLVTALRVHSELKLDQDKFNLVLDGYDETLVPRIADVISRQTGAERGKLVKNVAIALMGRGFGETTDGVTVVFAFTDGTEITGEIVTCADTYAEITFPEAMDALASGTKIDVTATRTINGIAYVSQEKQVEIA